MLQRRERRVEAVGRELVQRDRLGEVLQMCAQVRSTRTPGVSKRVEHRLRRDDLASVRGGADPRREMHVEAGEVVEQTNGRAGVEPDTHPHGPAVRPVVAASRALRRRARR